jgi:quercetin dioxygenase-like cupin family protein
MHEAGSRETALVTAGRVRLVCAGSEYDLGEGDTVTFDADLPHHFDNLETDEARLFAVVSAGLRRS